VLRNLQTVSLGNLVNRGNGGILLTQLLHETLRLVTMP
jgi:hypothetical protein